MPLKQTKYCENEKPDDGASTSALTLMEARHCEGQ
jgi:hypothetical protein